MKVWNHFSVLQTVSYPGRMQIVALLLTKQKVLWILGGKQPANITLLVCLGYKELLATLVSWRHTGAFSVGKSRLVMFYGLSLWGGWFVQLKSGCRTGSEGFLWLIPFLSREICVSDPKQSIFPQAWELRDLITCSSWGLPPPPGEFGWMFWGRLRGVSLLLCSSDEMGLRAQAHHAPDFACFVYTLCSEQR